MMMRKYSLLLFVLAVAILSITACDAAPKPPIRIAVIMPSSKTDLAFSQSMALAVQSVQAEMGGESALIAIYSENMFKVPDAEVAIRKYASDGVDIVIAHGSQYGQVIEAVAKDFPKTTFAWGTEENTFGLPNVYSYTAAAEQGGFVNGVLAAHLTQSKQIGITGPVGVGDAKTYADGFIQGVASVDPGIKVSTTWTESFSDASLMAKAAQTYITSGADILTGSSQSIVGSVNAAKENGRVLWFGTQSDQASLAPNLVVASQVYDWTAMLKEIIKNRDAGILGNKYYALSLKNDGLKILYNPGYPLPADIKAAGDKAIENIKNGTIIVNP
jgi:basic membrane protein A and related proteins